LDKEESDRQQQQFDERIKKKQDAEDKAAAEEAERNRQAYLNRTGRKTLTP
jgi:hypothetical protein